MTPATPLVEWATRFAEKAGKPDAAKFVYDWVKVSGGIPTSPRELDRLRRAIEQGFNTVGYRYSTSPARDEKHLQKMLLNPEQLTGRSRAFHVDITPDAPAAKLRAFNVTHDHDAFEEAYPKIRPLALKLENLVGGTDEQANSTQFLTDALNKYATGVKYSPVQGELKNADSVAMKSFAQNSNGSIQPSLAMIDPTAVRDLRTAKFQNLSKPALAAAVAAGATPLLKAEEKPMTFSDSIRATPQNRFVGNIAELMKLARKYGNKVDLPVLGGVGTMLLGQSPEEVENWSYGDLPMRVPEMTNVPQFKPGRAESLADTALAAPLAQPFARAAMNLPRSVARAAGDFAAAAGQPAVNVIKPKGGNWLAGSIEDSIRPLKRLFIGNDPATRLRYLDDTQAKYIKEGTMFDPAVFARERARLESNAAINQWLDQKLANYIRNDMATPEDPIRLMADAWPAQRDAKLATLQAKIDKLQAKKAASDPRAAPMIDRDIDAVREQMQAVSDYQPLHFAPDDMLAIDPPSMALQDRRKQAGFPPKGLAAADDAKRWETLADATISRNQASNYEKWPRNIVDKNLHWL